MEETDILVDRQGHVAIVTLNRPQAMNAVTIPMCDRLTEACNELNDDHDVRAIVLTGAGERAFSSGLDLKANNLSDPKRRTPYRMLHFDDHAVARLRRLAKPVIVAVNGVAVGAGLGFAIAGDIRIASETARFSAIFSKVGMPPQDAVAAFLPQIVGLPRALEMILTARMVGAAEALEIGLVTELVPADRLMERALEIAATIAKGPPLAIAMAKQVVYRSLHKSVDDQLALQNLGTFINSAYAKHDIDEAVAAFSEKRDAEFTGP
ncbi:enoyl-CoA hydratase/isomerase family protein [Novosphingobium sp. G106]|uniref:enoyl-CoA hydratase/isomerase family protein n=1 Tax=Novosphingobium sp. G106 TaxID=2849500 RepID=UPI001C2CEF65|nr:enoyl-CoA hydratase-related protein [Novosphingobium sp. G106]MBV1688935.1 enoyl-CoA hydratase/isomerase family protein [Novosphingobium sp. G106]